MGARGLAMNAVARLGAFALEQLRGWGHAAFFFGELLRALRRLSGLPRRPQE